jgi:hypothetical protein
MMEIGSHLDNVSNELHGVNYSERNSPEFDNRKIMMGALDKIFEKEKI